MLGSDRRPRSERTNRSRATRRRLLSGLAGLAVLSGCNALSPFRPDYEEYACTDVDDEPTRRYQPADDGLPISFEIPETVDHVETGTTRSTVFAEFQYRWRQAGGQGVDGAEHRITLRVTYGRSGLDSKSEYWGGREPTAVGTVRYGGESNRIVETDSGATAAAVRLLVPRIDGSVYDLITVRTDAIMGGDPELAERRETDPDQTCGEAVGRVALRVAESLEPAR